MRPPRRRARWEGKSLARRPPLGGLDRIVKQHGDRHRTHPTRHRRDRRRDLTGRLKIHVAHQLGTVVRRRVVDPVHPDTDLLCNLGMNQFILGLLEESAYSLERSIAYSPGHELAYPALAAIYGIQGREQDARDLIKDLNKLSVSPVNMNEFIVDRYSSERTQRRIRDGLRKAGLLG